MPNGLNDKFDAEHERSGAFCHFLLSLFTTTMLVLGSPLFSHGVYRTFEIIPTPFCLCESSLLDRVVQRGYLLGGWDRLACCVGRIGNLC